MEDGEEKVSYTQGVKKKHNFWQSLEAYGWQVARRTPLPRYWQWVGVGLLGAIFATSWANLPDSLARVESQEEAVRRAATKGDYELAQKLYQVSGSEYQVLGAESELEELVYPESKLAREIGKWESKLAEYPGNREVMRGLVNLYDLAGEKEKASQLRERIRILDPNE